MDRSLYTRPKKPKTIPVKKRARFFALDEIEPVTLLAVDAGTECHVTPSIVADRMADYLELEEGLSVFEPQCGTGALIAAVRDYGCDNQVTGIERHTEIYKSVSLRFRGDDKVLLISGCFLEYGAACNDRFDRIITNPPFKKVRDHMKVALSLLKPGGVMVALVPSTFEHPGAEFLESLGPDTFACAAVHTKLVRFRG